jgi:hypothetical protein
MRTAKRSKSRFARGAPIASSATGSATNAAAPSPPEKPISNTHSPKTSTPAAKLSVT